MRPYRIRFYAILSLCKSRKGQWGAHYHEEPVPTSYSLIVIALFGAIVVSGADDSRVLSVAARTHTSLGENTNCFRKGSVK